MIDTDFLQPKYDINQVIVNLAIGDIESKELVDGRTTKLFIRNLLCSPEVHCREGITELAEYIDNLPESLGEDPFPLFHSFSEGLYSREIHLPKGFFIVGKLHKHESMVYMIKGKVLVADEFGSKIVEAPCQFVSKPGIKRVGYVYEDVVWIDVHATDKTNVEDAEKEIFASSYDEIETYSEMIKSLGFTEEEVRAISENTDDIVDDNNIVVYVKESDIEGNGVFSVGAINPQDQIGVARLKDKRTALGRFTNHSFRPNARCEIKNNSIYFIATKAIKADEEITVDYRNVRKYSEELDSMNTDYNGWSSCQV